MVIYRDCEIFLIAFPRPSYDLLRLTGSWERAYALVSWPPLRNASGPILFWLTPLLESLVVVALMHSMLLSWAGGGAYSGRCDSAAKSRTVPEVGASHQVHLQSSHPQLASARNPRMEALQLVNAQGWLLGVQLERCSARKVRRQVGWYAFRLGILRRLCYTRLKWLAAP